MRWIPSLIDCLKLYEVVVALEINRTYAVSRRCCRFKISCFVYFVFTFLNYTTLFSGKAVFCFLLHTDQAWLRK